MKLKDYVFAAGIILAIVVGVNFPVGGQTIVEKTIEKMGAVPGGTHTEYEEFMGGFAKGKYLATSTTLTSQTLVANDLTANNDVIAVTANVGSLTYTFPASSSLKAFVPRAGMTQDVCYYNATSTAGVNLVFAAGTGIDAQMASSSNTTLAKDLTIAKGGMGCFKFVRQPDTDISALLTEFEDAD